LWVWQNGIVEAQVVGVFISRSWGRDRQSRGDTGEWWVRERVREVGRLRTWAERASRAVTAQTRLIAKSGSLTIAAWRREREIKAFVLYILECVEEEQCV
jgi:hypothetical protein